MADPLAYCAHDLEDALNAGYLTLVEIRKMKNPLIDRILEKCSMNHEFNDSDMVLQSRLLVRTLIEEANILVIEQTMKNLETYRINTAEDARPIGIDMVCMPADEWHNFEKIKSYLFDHVYRRPQVCIMNEKGKLILSRIFVHLEANPGMLPPIFKERINGQTSKTVTRRVIAEYIAGMTDRYAMDLYKMMFEPYEKVMFGFRD